MPAAPSRRAFIFSILLHGLVIVLLGTVLAASPEVRRMVEHATLLAPVPEVPDRPAAPKLAPVIRRPAFVLPNNPLPAPVVVLPAPPAPIPAAPKLAKVIPETPALLAPAPAPPPTPAPPAPTVRTGVFAGVTAPPVANPKPALPVETGTFQAPVSNEKAAARTVTKTGVFDSGEKPTGGTGVPKAKVAAAGFGDARSNDAGGSPRGVAGSHGDAGFGAVAAAKPAAETKPAAVRAGGFDSSIAAPSAVPQRQIEQAPPTEVEILFKPRPAYTEEARKLKIEGEVLVEVLFAASGEVKVLGVKKGLGHGLDEAAVRAAENIRFKPAKRGGTAVDSTAIARITFELAY